MGHVFAGGGHIELVFVYVGVCVGGVSARVGVGGVCVGVYVDGVGDLCVCIGGVCVDACVVVGSVWLVLVVFVMAVSVNLCCC